MTVKELVQRLLRYDKDLPVVLWIEEGNTRPLQRVFLSDVRINMEYVSHDGKEEDTEIPMVAEKKLTQVVIVDGVVLK